MPRSKHRRKPGGKAVRHPGRGRAARLSPELDAEMMLWNRFRAGYSVPFLEKTGYEDPSNAGYLLDLISEGAWEPTRDGALSPISKAKMFREFMHPGAWEGEALPTVETFETALDLLVAEGLAEVEGEEIRVPERFSVKPLPPAE